MTDIQSRFPPLSLDRGDRKAARLTPEIGPEHGLYAIAAWIWHHADELEESYSRSLFVALERAWPRAKARPRTRTGTRLLVSLLKDGGIATRTIADRLHISTSNVNNLNREERRSREEHARTGARPRLVRPDPEDLRIPYDPATWIGEQFARGADAFIPSFAHDLESAEELAREKGMSLEELANRPR